MSTATSLLGVCQHAPAGRYTTPELIDTEHDTIERVRAGRDEPQPIDSTTASAIGKRYGARLNEDPLRLVHEVLVSRDQTFGIQGGAEPARRLHSAP